MLWLIKVSVSTFLGKKPRKKYYIDKQLLNNSPSPDLTDKKAGSNTHYDRFQAN